jgi:hypothetical protein
VALDQRRVGPVVGQHLVPSVGHARPLGWGGDRRDEGREHRYQAFHLPLGSQAPYGRRRQVVSALGVWGRRHEEPRINPSAQKHAAA